MNLKEINFWKRLRFFIKDVETNDPMSEEEKEMILNVCRYQGEARPTNLKERRLELIVPDSEFTAVKCLDCGKSFKDKMI